MVAIEREKKFDEAIKKIKNIGLKEEIKKCIKKIIKNPKRIKFLRGELKKEKKEYVRNFRLLYSYDFNTDTIHLIDFDKRSRIYKKKR